MISPKVLEYDKINWVAILIFYTMTWPISFTCIWPILIEIQRSHCLIVWQMMQMKTIITEYTAAIHRPVLCPSPEWVVCTKQTVGIELGTGAFPFCSNFSQWQTLYMTKWQEWHRKYRGDYCTWTHEVAFQTISILNSIIDMTKWRSIIAPGSDYQYISIIVPALHFSIFLIFSGWFV